MSFKQNKCKNIKVSVIIPTYNEERTIFNLINDIKKIMLSYSYTYELIIIDDGSKDKTKELLNKIDGIRVISHPYNKGYGASLKTGILAAKNTLIIMLDGDGTYSPEDIPKLLKYYENYDLISGARVGTNVKIPLLRKPAKFILKTLAQFLAGKKIPDLNCGLRIIKKDNALKFFYLLPSRFSFTTTHLLACLTNDCNVKFVPITYKKRKGKSTIHPIIDFINFFNIIIRIIVYFNPFKFFFMLSLFLFIIAFFVWFYTLSILHKIADISVIMLFISSLQIFIFGLLADLIVKTNKQRGN